MANVEITINEAGFVELANDEAMRTAVVTAADRVASLARSNAPRKTGAGAGSIHSDPQLGDEGWEAHVSWDEDHQYMAAQKSGALQDATDALSVNG